MELTLTGVQQTELSIKICLLNVALCISHHCDECVTSAPLGIKTACWRLKWLNSAFQFFFFAFKGGWLLIFYQKKRGIFVLVKSLNQNLWMTTICSRCLKTLYVISRVVSLFLILLKSYFFIWQAWPSHDIFHSVLILFTEKSIS